MLILSTWTPVYRIVLLFWACFVLSSCCVEGLATTISKGLLSCSPVHPAKNSAFIGNFLPPAKCGIGKKRRVSLGAENDELQSQQVSEAAYHTPSGAIDVGRRLGMRVKLFSDAISDHARGICQRVKKSLVLQKIRKGVEVVKKRMTNLSFAQQVALVLLGKLIYVFVLPGFHILFPYQLLPVDSGLGTDIGLDTVVSLFSFYALMKSMREPAEPLDLEKRDMLTLPLVAAGLMGSFYLSGYAAQMVDCLMLMLSAVDVPVSVGLQRALRILLSHLSWVLIGAKILNYAVPINELKSKWLSLDYNDLWAYKALAGYFVSCTVYNGADLLFCALEKLRRGHDAHHPETEDYLDSNPLVEPNYIIPTVISAIGPCVTAPWWEEMLYRVFVFKTLNAKLPRNIASALSSFMFAVHHLNPRSVLQLFALGLLWTLVEQGTNNLFVSIAIHSLWNTRIMLGTLLGL